jgi:uncharacterized OsmC-like protein
MDLITVTRKAGMAFEVRVRGHRLDCDMSVADGGHGEGFSPAELFAGTLGACVAMMAQRYLDESGNGKGDVAVSVVLEMADAPKRVASLVVDLELPEGVPENRETAIRRVVEQGVIYETLRRTPEVDVDIQFN